MFKRLSIVALAALVAAIGPASAQSKKDSVVVGMTLEPPGLDPTSAAAAAIAALALFSIRKNRVPMQRWWGPLLVIAPLAAVFGNSFGWIFTEMGRQPWVVFGVYTTAQGVSPSVTSSDIIISMTVYTLLYAALAVVEVRLFMRYVRKGAEPYEPVTQHEGEDQLSFSY